MSLFIYTEANGDSPAPGETFFTTLEDGSGVELMETGDKVLNEDAP